MQGETPGGCGGTYEKFCDMEVLDKEIQNPKSDVPGEQRVGN